MSVISDRDATNEPVDRKPLPAAQTHEQRQAWGVPGLPFCIGVWVMFAGGVTLLFYGSGPAVLGIILLFRNPLYAILHDLLVHRRIPFKGQPRGGYLKRLVQAHRLHHAVRSRDGAVSFGFLYAPPIEKLVTQLRKTTKAR